ncbi:MAG: peptide chain release factor 1 [Bacteroidetes bacterium RIFOXYA12_FULL_35_11]|nr:MAG: peptide chain release factor 1 [Bacteroidetes bacterium GWF2_35_48]OFY74089.1 MAG: peptide chain release factor 1 [Bacteroidetes bacterium RIFOXYA12_FULL_35_11]OFY95338.1 MAG: peptide chain release factor 1 [Bacteroidetes bacterium RIFOXYB2_FULL_35_7]OFZ03295.1 MAG: peptide chain release factor 1 [Bacteroidetes bacterium RIFOXYC12_FULL_35_7]HBX51890.1 aminoacyl-tRNA hydrolase [Bacteroidales bacterium]
MKDFLPEFTFSASRSSGAGGQNVNKVSTKVELRFHVEDSEILTQEQKNILLEKLADTITNEGFIRIVSQTERTQLKNKKKCIEKFYILIEKCLKKKKKRKPTKPTEKSKEKKKQEKISLSRKKAERKKVGDVE